MFRMNNVFLASLIASLLTFVSLASAHAVPLANGIKGFREWKIDKIQIAQAQTNNTRNLLLKAKADGLKSNVETLEREINQLQWNLDITKDLSVADYVVLYLSHLNQSDRFQQAATKLSTAEVAELMEVCVNSLGTPTPADAVTLHSSPASSPRQLPTQATRQTREPLK